MGKKPNYIGDDIAVILFAEDSEGVLRQKISQYCCDVQEQNQADTDVVFTAVQKRHDLNKSSSGRNQILTACSSDLKIDCFKHVYMVANIILSCGKLTFVTSFCSSSDDFMDALLEFSQIQVLQYAAVRRLFFSDLLRKLQGLFLNLSNIKDLKHLQLQ